MSLSISSKHSRAICCVLMGGLLLLSENATLGQGDAPLIPRDPIIPRAPNLIAWTVHYKETGAALKAPTGGDHPQPVAVEAGRITSIKVEKSGTTYHQTVIYAAQPATEVWIVNSYQLCRYLGQSWTVMPPLNENHLNFGGGDFADLDWVRMTDYVGVQAYGDKPAFLFQVDNAKRPLSPREQQTLTMIKNLSPSLPPTEKNPEARTVSTNKAVDAFMKARSHGVSKALLDAATQLPLEVSDGEVTSTYTYAGLPGGTLVPPPDVVEALQKLQEIRRAATVPPSHS